MSFFKKTLATFGIGSAKVDTVLKQDAAFPGRKLVMDVHVYGGATKQDIDNIDLKLCCHYRKPRQNPDGHEITHSTEVATHVLSSWSLPYAFSIEPHQERIFPVELDIPWNTPVTLGDAKVWLETGLDISMTSDPSDKDEVTIRPDLLEDAIFTALENAGLRIRQVECEYVKGFDLPFVQEFEFVPVHGDFQGRWRELEIVIYRNESELNIWFEVDRQKQGIGGMLSSLIGSHKLKREMTLSADIAPQEAGAQVLAFLNQTT